MSPSRRPIDSQAGDSRPERERPADTEDYSTTAHSYPTGPQPSGEQHEAPLPSGTMLGNCRVLRLLGRGGMGEVYLAWNETLGCHRAVKLVARSHSSHPQALARFRREVRLLAQLQHPNIAAANDAGESGTRLYLVMEYVAGKTLAELVRHHGPLPALPAVQHIRQAAMALAYAHDKGVVHRDVKPSNVMLGEDGAIKLLDLGVARISAPQDAAQEGDTQVGTLIGTADYLAPEQFENPASVDGRSDLYSLGCTLYHLLSGHAPFAHRAGMMEKVVAHTQEDPPPLPAAGQIPQSLIAVLNRLMAKRPEDRFATASELVEALDAALAELEPTAQASGSQQAIETPTPPAGSRVTSRRKWLLALAAVLLIAGAWGMWQVISGSASGTRSAAAPQGDPAPPPPADPSPVTVRELSLRVLPDGTQGPRSQYQLVAGDNGDVDTVWEQPLSHASLFQLAATFDRPTPWFVVWLDTSGRAQLQDDHSIQPASQLSFPQGDIFVGVNREDPPGVHLLLLVVCGEQDAGGAVQELDSHLAALSETQRLEIGRLGAQLGGGSLALRVSQKRHARLQQLLPDGYWVVEGVCLPTTP